jgi:hypothetical protein
MKTVPLRKAVEAATATTALRKEASAQQQIEQTIHAVARSDAEARAAARAAKRQPPAKPVASTPVTPAPVAAPPVRLVSVLDVGGQRAAVVTVGDASMIVRQGERSPLGLVDIANDSTVRLGGQLYTVNTHTLARAVLPDHAVQKGTETTPAGNASSASNRPSNSSAGLPPVLPASSGAASTLPPLQLPAGVRLLPR